MTLVYQKNKTKTENWKLVLNPFQRWPRRRRRIRLAGRLFSVVPPPQNRDDPFTVADLTAVLRNAGRASDNDVDIEHDGKECSGQAGIFSGESRHGRDPAQLRIYRSNTPTSSTSGTVLDHRQDNAVVEILLLCNMVNGLVFQTKIRLKLVHKMDEYYSVFSCYLLYNIKLEAKDIFGTMIQNCFVILAKIYFELLLISNKVTTALEWSAAESLSYKKRLLH